MKQICVVGVGYVGLVTAACFADLGNRVIALDVDEQRVENLKKGIMPIYEPGLEELVKRNVKGGRLTFTTSYAEAFKGAEFAFIAVGTPSGVDGEADLQYVAAAAQIDCRKHDRAADHHQQIHGSDRDRGLGGRYCQERPAQADRFRGRLLPRIPARRFGHRRFHEPAPQRDRFAGQGCRQQGCAVALALACAHRHHRSAHR